MKKVFFGLLVAGVALAGSAFTNANHLAAGDYQFYNKSGIIHDTDPTQYVYRTTKLCSDQGDVCSEVWNIGSSTPTPANGTLLSAYTTKVYVGNLTTGTYTGN